MMRAIRVALLGMRELALAGLEPRALRAVRHALEQPPRALQPSAGDGGLAPKCPAIPREPDGDPRRAPLVVALEVQRVSALTRVEHDVRVVEPPRGQRETLVRLRRLAVRQRLLKRRPRIRPRPA